MAVRDIAAKSVRDESRSAEEALTTIETSASPPSSGFALAKYGGRRPSAPSWFKSAVAALPKPSFVDVEGVKIEYLVLGKSLRPGLLLVPGRRANVHWWAPLVPALARDFRVATLSLSGMGKSGWRHGYSSVQYSREIKAVAEVAGLFDYGPPILIAHSFGASPASAALASGWPGGAIIVDSPVDSRTGFRPRVKGRGNSRRFSTIGQALGRFRLIPPQVCANDFMIDFLARKAVRRRDVGWEWSYDPECYVRTDHCDSRAQLIASGKPLAFIHGRQSDVVTSSVLASQKSDFPDAPFVGIPECGHHALVDQPLMLLAALRSLLATKFELGGE